jgi:hypothetical protein
VSNLSAESGNSMLWRCPECIILAPASDNAEASSPFGR